MTQLTGYGTSATADSHTGQLGTEFAEVRASSAEVGVEKQAVPYSDSRVGNIGKDSIPCS